MKVADRIVTGTFKGNPKSTIISCYSPHSGYSKDEKEEFYNTLSNRYSSVPRHSFVLICGDFNAQLKGLFSYYTESNRNGSYLQDFLNESNLIACSTMFEKKKKQSLDLEISEQHPRPN